MPTTLAQARQAWEDGEFDQAERDYQQALEHGGLDRSATLECYVHIGAIRAVLGKKDGAIVAFRTALFIDDGFTVPPEAGKKAVALAETARRQRGRVGMLHLDVIAPEEVASGEPFTVNVMINAAQAALVTRLSLRVKDTTTNKTYADEQPAGAFVHFSVPTSMTLPRATLHMQVSALDGHDNQLGSSDGHVSVRATPVREGLLDQTTHRHDKDAEKQAPGGFWSSPWPYVIGGFVLAAGAATGAYFLLKPPDQVSIGPAMVQTY